MGIISTWPHLPIRRKPIAHCSWNAHRSEAAVKITRGYSYERDMLSFQKIDYPPWDMYFCQQAEYRFPLIDYLCDTFDLHAEFDCTLFMQRTRQTWGTSWLYR